MSYQKPNTSGLIQLTDIDLREIVPFIDWVFFLWLGGSPANTME